MTAYTTSTNVEKFSKRKQNFSDSEEKTERNRKNWKTQHYAKRLQKRRIQDELN